jgi:NAD(P)-dependent dehydrogenase (short-subunit alcohol dehydrogenase family)
MDLGLTNKVALVTAASKGSGKGTVDELAGYADYAAKVRNRLIPGVW